MSPLVTEKKERKNGVETMVSKGSGTVHDTGDPESSTSQGIGYIYVREIDGKSPKRSQYLPFVIEEPSEKLLRVGDRVTFEIAFNVIYPSNGIGAGESLPRISMATNVGCNDNY